MPGTVLSPLFATVGILLDRILGSLKAADEHVESIGKPAGAAPPVRRPPRPAAELYRQFARGGLVGNLFRLIGMTIEVAVLTAIVPIKFFFAVFGRLLDMLVNLPFRLLGLAVKLVVIVVGFFFLFFFVRLSFYFLFRIL
jgi:hypothetical protein